MRKKKKKEKKTRKKKKKHKPDETLRDRDVENPYPRMSLASTIVRRSLPFSPDRPRLNVRHPAFNRTVTRHDTVSFSIFRLLIRLSRDRPCEALHRDAAAAATVAAMVQRMNEQPHWQRSRS